MVYHVSNLVPKYGLEIPVWDSCRSTPGRVPPLSEASKRMNIASDLLIIALRSWGPCLGYFDCLLHVLGYRPDQFEHRDLRGQNPHIGLPAAVGPDPRQRSVLWLRVSVPRRREKKLHSNVHSETPS